jgi:prophage antirepressor-like protein
MNTFDFQGTALRTIEIDGEPWFVATDVCQCIGMSVAHGVGSWIRHLSSDERRLLTRKSHHDLIAGWTVAPSVTVISEPGLYRLLMRTDKPQARPFQDWVTREVLPSIRRTGGYLLNEDARQ